MLEVHAQPVYSLLQKLKTATEDTAKIRLLNKAGAYYTSNNFDSACFYFEAAKRLSEKLSYRTGVVNYYLNMHGAYLENGKYDSSLIIMEGRAFAGKTIGYKITISQVLRKH